MSLNKVMLIASVGSMEIKTFDGQNGPRKCATLSVATNERYKDRTGNIVTNTEWHNIVSWNHAELCDKYVQKGSLLYIEGKLRTRAWDDQHGNKRYTTEVLAEKITLLGKKESSQGNQQQKPAPAQQPQQNAATHSAGHTEPLPPAGPPQDDDLPF